MLLIIRYIEKFQSDALTVTNTPASQPAIHPTKVVFIWISFHFTSFTIEVFNRRHRFWCIRQTLAFSMNYKQNILSCRWIFNPSWSPQHSNAHTKWMWSITDDGRLISRINKKNNKESQKCTLHLALSITYIEFLIFFPWKPFFGAILRYFQ